MRTQRSTSKSQSNHNLAARVGRWSVQNRRKAILGWLAFVFISLVVGFNLVPQKNLDATFGQPPITLFHHDRFYIEALFWLSSTTSIHQHAFAGAFSVLAGSSVQARYRFEPRTGVERRLRFGHVSLRVV